MHSKSYPVALIALAIFVGTLLGPLPSGGQTGEDIALVQLASELTTQQAAIIDNQAKIDAKLATIGENIRLARIYTGRGK